jgi:hypothetical protein
MNLAIKFVAATAVLFGCCVYVPCKLLWDSYGFLFVVVVIGLPLLWWAAIWGCPS